MIVKQLRLEDMGMQKNPHAGLYLFFYFFLFSIYKQCPLIFCQEFHPKKETRLLHKETVCKELSVDKFNQINVY